jgi:hypothetical protein
MIKVGKIAYRDNEVDSSPDSVQIGVGDGMHHAVRRNWSVNIEHRSKGFQTRNAQVKAYARGLRKKSGRAQDGAERALGPRSFDRHAHLVSRALCGI